MTAWTNAWMCLECWTEGRGHKPDECPKCGTSGSWFETSVEPGDTRTSKEVYDEAMGFIFNRTGTMMYPDNSSLLDFLRQHFPGDVEGMSDAEAIGRKMLRISQTGHRMWAGVRILKSLGVYIEREEQRPN